MLRCKIAAYPSTCRFQVVYKLMTAPWNSASVRASTNRERLSLTSGPDTDVIHLLRRSWNSSRTRVIYHSLHGEAEDGTTLDTSHLHFTSLNESWNRDTGSAMSPLGSSAQTTFRRKLVAPPPKPRLRMWLKGFRHYPPSRTTCPLGTIEVAGATSLPDPDIMTGNIALSPDHAPADLLAWRSEAETLLEHVRAIMSFAAGTVLRVPIIEYFEADGVEAIATSQTRQSLATIRTFHFMGQQPAFEAAVNCFFSPPVEAKNLFFAIEWFAMETTYNEARLINAMTALENLLASNLNEEDIFLQPEDEFNKKIRCDFKKVIGDKIATWLPEARQEVYEKLGELNRRALLRKLKILAERWSVPLDGIPEEKIKAAKAARDHIVHRGHFHEDDFNRAWEHVTVVREVLVRFLLTAIGYRGRVYLAPRRSSRG